MRSEVLGKVSINLHQYAIVQLSNHVQRDGSSCGVYCLKVLELLYTAVCSFVYIYLVINRWLNRYWDMAGLMKDTYLATMNVNKDAIFLSHMYPLIITVEGVGSPALLHSQPCYCTFHRESLWTSNVPLYFVLCQENWMLLLLHVMYFPPNRPIKVAFPEISWMLIWHHNEQSQL